MGTHMGAACTQRLATPRLALGSPHGAYHTRHTYHTRSRNSTALLGGGYLDRGLQLPCPQLPCPCM